MIENPYKKFDYAEIDQNTHLDKVTEMIREDLHYWTFNEAISAVIKWGDEDCPHVHKTLPNRPKRACDECWSELKEKYGR